MKTIQEVILKIEKNIEILEVRREELERYIVKFKGDMPTETFRASEKVRLITAGELLSLRHLQDFIKGFTE